MISPLPPSTTVRELLERVTYKPGWRFKLLDTDLGALRLKIAAQVPDATGREDGTIWIQTLYPLPAGHELWHPHTFLRWLHDRILEVETHEIHEWLRFDDVHVIEPHPELPREKNG